MRITRKEIIFFVSLLMVFALAYAVTVVKNSHRADLAKKDMEIAEIKIEAEKKSDIEILSELSINYKKQEEIEIRVPFDGKARASNKRTDGGAAVTAVVVTDVVLLAPKSHKRRHAQKEGSTRFKHTVHLSQCSCLVGDVT